MDVSFLIFLNSLYFYFSSVSYVVTEEQHYGFCANDLCTEPIGMGRTLLHYTGADKQKLNFLPNEEFTFYVKDAGPKRNLFGVKMNNGNWGYIPKQLIKEEKLYVKDLVPGRIEFLLSNLGTLQYQDSQVLHSGSLVADIARISQSFTGPDSNIFNENFEQTNQFYASGGSQVFSQSPNSDQKQFVQSSPPNTYSGIQVTDQTAPFQANSPDQPPVQFLYSSAYETPQWEDTSLQASFSSPIQNIPPTSSFQDSVNNAQSGAPNQAFYSEFPHTQQQLSGQLPNNNPPNGQIQFNSGFQNSHALHLQSSQIFQSDSSNLPPTSPELNHANGPSNFQLVVNNGYENDQHPIQSSSDGYTQNGFGVHTDIPHNFVSQDQVVTHNSFHVIQNDVQTGFLPSPSISNDIQMEYASMSSQTGGSNIHSKFPPSDINNIHSGHLPMSSQIGLPQSNINYDIQSGHSHMDSQTVGGDSNMQIVSSNINSGVIMDYSSTVDTSGVQKDSSSDFSLSNNVKQYSNAQPDISASSQFFDKHFNDYSASPKPFVSYESDLPLYDDTSALLQKHGYDYDEINMDYSDETQLHSFAKTSQNIYYQGKDPSVDTLSSQPSYPESYIGNIYSQTNTPQVQTDTGTDHNNVEHNTNVEHSPHIASTYDHSLPPVHGSVDAMKDLNVEDISNIAFTAEHPNAIQEQRIIDTDKDSNVEVNPSNASTFIQPNVSLHNSLDFGDSLITNRNSSKSIDEDKGLNSNVKDYSDFQTPSDETLPDKSLSFENESGDDEDKLEKQVETENKVEIDSTLGKGKPLENFDIKKEFRKRFNQQMVDKQEKANQQENNVLQHISQNSEDVIIEPAPYGNMESILKFPSDINAQNVNGDMKAKSAIVQNAQETNIEKEESTSLYENEFQEPSLKNISTTKIEEKTDELLNIISNNSKKTDDTLYNIEMPSQDSGVNTTDKKNYVTELDNVLDISDSDNLNPYQIRNLKEDNKINEANSDEVQEFEVSAEEFNLYEILQNGLLSVKSFTEAVLLWVPEPLYSAIMDLEMKGISPRVPVFTTLISIPCVIMIICLVYIKEKSELKKLVEKLTACEKNVYMLFAEKNVLEEQIEKSETELQSSKSTFLEEKIKFDDLRVKIKDLEEDLRKNNHKLEDSTEEIQSLKERDKEYAELITDHEKAYLILLNEKSQLESHLTDLEDTVNKLHDELKEKEETINELGKAKDVFKTALEESEEKSNHLKQNCNQLLNEAEVWNKRVNELSTQFNEITALKDDLENTVESKDSEIEVLTNAIHNLKAFEEDIEENENKDEKLQNLFNSSALSIKLKRQEEENTMLSEKLSNEKNKILEIEIAVEDLKSENDKLKLHYNQALQDKTEAQTKLDVLSNYFKDKELQLQKQLGAHEAVRERREKDANSAERRIILIEQENTSYKSQVASMKQEMEETERNLKNQIASQEKKAHENWIAARTAERKLEDMKQEVTQLHQRLTLLEREQENWVSNSRDDIVRPIPKRINDESMNSHDSMDIRPSLFPLPPMMLPADRPLPPLPPPIPPFMVPSLMDGPHFRHQPWHLPPEHPDFRMSPPDFSRVRASTPPRGRHTEGDIGPTHSSPLISDARDSRNSTPPHSLPDFHDIPPPPRPPFFAGPGGHPRFPMPPFRREMPPGGRRQDNPNDTSIGRGPQQPPESWQHSNSRV